MECCNLRAHKVSSLTITARAMSTIHCLRSSRHGPKLPERRRLTSYSDETATYLLPLNPSLERKERRRRKQEKLNKPLPPTPLAKTDSDLMASASDMSSLLPLRVCKHLHRLVQQELKTVSHQRYHAIVHEFNLVPPSNTVLSLLRSRLYQKRLDELLRESNLDRYYALTLEVTDANNKDSIRMVKLVRHITASDMEENAALELDENTTDDLLDILQEILDANPAKEEDRVEMKRLMSKLVKKASGLPVTMFISGVALPRGQCSLGGTFGDIYKTLYRDQPVALKFLRILGSSPAEKRKTCKRFYKEALVWRKLDYKYVLPFLGVDTENIPGRPCMVSPWMANGNAHDFVKNHPKMNVDKLLFEIAQGIQYLHSKLVVHGDIKGLNILIDEQWHPRLADFGLTIWADVSKQDTTQRGGTVRWMAPELLHPTSFGQEDSQRTFATDVYAYGCVCLELHTRDKPFHDIHSEGVVSMKVAKGERPHRPTDPPFADELWNLVKACWQQFPEMRPQSAEIVEVLRSIFRKSAVEGGVDGLLRSGAVEEYPGTERRSFASILSGPLQDEPDDARLQAQFELALLQIRQHADPNRAYIKKRKLHKGFSVRVSLAKTTFNTTVTIKQINISTQNKSNLIDLINEFTALRFLPQDNLVGYVDLFRHDGDLWVVQDDISETVTLRQVLKTSSNEVERREPFMMKILPCILQGLDYLHRHRITHGYLGVVDVIFTKTACVRLRLCAMFPDQPIMRRPRVLPPELNVGAPYGPEADIWNLGLLIVEALDMERRLSLEEAPEIILTGCKSTLKVSPMMLKIISAALQPPKSRPSATEMLKLVSKSLSRRKDLSLHQSYIHSV